MNKSIMDYEPVLPENFDGTFRFTNWSDEDFVGKWGSKEYHFPAQTTSPLIITTLTALEIQQVRKKFAYDLAVREFGKSQQYQKMTEQERNADGTPRLNSIHQALSFSINELTPYIQKCLTTLPVAKVSVTKKKEENLEEKLTKNEKGELNTEVVDTKTSLRDKALRAK